MPSLIRTFPPPFSPFSPPFSPFSPPFSSFPIPVILANREPKDVEFNIKMKNEKNSILTDNSIIEIKKRIKDLEVFFLAIIKILCDSKNERIDKILKKIEDEVNSKILIADIAKYIFDNKDDATITEKEIKEIIYMKLIFFIKELHDRKDISKLCSLNHSVKILVGGGNRTSNIDIDFKKILSEKYDIESLNKESNFYNYNVEWMNSRKEFQNLIYKLLKPKSIDMFFDSMSKSMKLLDSVVLDKNKYSVYKHLYKLYQDKKMKNLI